MAPSTTRRELKNRSDRSAGTPAHGKFPLFFGLLFVAVGGAVVAIAMDWIHVDPSSINGPRWVLGSVGGIFALAGLALSGNAAWGLVRQARRDRRLRRYPHRPWLADHDWDPAEAAEDTLRKARRGFIAFLGMGLFLVPFHWWAFFSDEGPWLVKLIVGLFDAILLIVLGTAFYHLLAHLRWGGNRLRFQGFPFLLGDTLDAWFLAPRGIPGAEELKITLRCVEEAYEARGTGDNRSTRVVCYEVYRDERTIDLSTGGLGRGPLNLPVSFPLPEDAPSTKLSDRPPVYWEVAVEAETPGVDCRSTFLVPVYARP